MRRFLNYGLIANLVLAAVAVCVGTQNLLADTEPTTVKSEKKEVKPEEKINPALVQVNDVPGLPRVLLIGDSVSIQYTLQVRELLEGKANVHRPPLNCHSSRQVLEELEGYVGEKAWDVIHINCGGHDISHRKDGQYTPPPEGTINVPYDEYKSNLHAIVKRLKQTGAKLIWASTTPMSISYLAKGHRREQDLFAYNAAAAEIMNGAGIPINDLYAKTKADAETLLRDGVHFTKPGAKVLAKYVSDSIEKELAAKNASK